MSNRTFLHVGCGEKRKDKTTPTFAGDDWSELRLDINPAVNPDVLGSMTDMSSLPDASVDAVYSSHNLEHLYPFQVPLALGEFLRVLKPEGFVIATCPDLRSVCALIAEDRLTEAAYESPAGPITPLDILYGYRPALAQGNLHMAHRCGFTQSVLMATLEVNGFPSVAVMQRGAPYFDLWAVASKVHLDDEAIRGLAGQHFPQ